VQRYYFAMLFCFGLPLGMCFVAKQRWRRNSLLALMLLFIAIAVPACGGGGGGSSQQHQDPGTPAGTYTITVTAAGGSITQQGAFTLIVQ
jgi:hypothetical protein